MGVLRAPSSQAVCEHLGDLARQEGDTGAFDDTQRCVDELDRKLGGDTSGFHLLRPEHARQLDCMRQASSLGGALACGD
jgi:hypothetical protein